VAPVVRGYGAGDQTATPGRTGATLGSAITDQYANRHNPFIYFHSVVDNQRLCDIHVVPLRTASTAAGGSTTFSGHLANDLSKLSTTPRFAFITPNLCDDWWSSPSTRDRPPTPLLATMSSQARATSIPDIALC